MRGGPFGGMVPGTDSALSTGTTSQAARTAAIRSDAGVASSSTRTRPEVCGQTNGYSRCMSRRACGIRPKQRRDDNGYSRLHDLPNARSSQSADLNAVAVMSTWLASSGPNAPPVKTTSLVLEGMTVNRFGMIRAESSANPDNIPDTTLINEANLRAAER